MSVKEKKSKKSSRVRNLKQRQKEKAATKEKHWVRLTRVCNNNCIFCLDKDAQDGTFISLGQIRKSFLKGRQKKIEQVILSGGEATIHPNFLKIVKMAKKSGYQHVQVITNGRMFSYPDFLLHAVGAGVNEITFSMHGHTAELHDAQTQIKGSFTQALGGLKNALVTGRLIVNVDIVINKQNYKHLHDILKFFMDLGIHEFDLLQVIPFGRAWENKEKLFYDIDDALPYLKKAFCLSKKHGVYIWTNRFPPAYLEGYEDLIQHPKKLYDEIRGRQDMFEIFLKKGRMMRCHGKRCEFCFLNDFCKDLIEFRQKGKSASKDSPICLKKEFRKKRQISFKGGREPDIFQFLDFFIDNRYFVKGEKCKKLCSKSSECNGMQINYIRKNGFKSLVPVI